MKKQLTGLFILILISTACQNKKVSSLYNQAEELYSAKNYNSAKILIDSILTTYPTNIEFSTRSKELLRTIAKAEQENNMRFLDSLLDEKEKELLPLMKNFEVNNETGGTPVLIHKRQKTENSFNRTFLMANVNLKGEFYISSRYTGTGRIHHNQIKVYDQSTTATSEIIEEDGLMNRSFDDGDWHWEVIQYKDGRDNGIADLISTHIEQPLKVEFIGKKRQYIVMEKFDKEAIRDAYEISFLLREIEKIKEQQQNVKSTMNQTK